MTGKLRTWVFVSASVHLMYLLDVRGLCHQFFISRSHHGHVLLPGPARRSRRLVTCYPFTRVPQNPLVVVPIVLASRRSLSLRGKFGATS